MNFNHCLAAMGASLLALGISPSISHSLEAQPQILPNPAVIAKKSMTQWRNGSFPVENFQGYTSPFGYRTSPTGGYSREFHSGLDFAAPTGSYIRSWWGGKVIQVSHRTACGTSVRVQSGSWVHVYCHMKGYVTKDSRGRVIVDRGSGLKIREGQMVKAGQRIGRIGLTGRTTGPHLHWTLKYQGKFVDPGAVLRAMYVAQRQGGRVSSHQ